RHARHAVFRSDRAVPVECLERARPRAARARYATARCNRPIFHPRKRDRLRPWATNRVPQHQRTGTRGAVGHRSFQDRLHQRGGSLPGDARAPGFALSGRRSARFVGQVFAYRRRQPDPQVARNERRRKAEHLGSVRFFGSVVDAGTFREDVIAGLSLPQKALPPKYFYDAAGSRLFEAICRLEEYYPTRVELALTRAHLDDIARFAGERCQLIEYGSGESLKTRLLIRRLRPSAYVPVDISEAALQAAAKRLARTFTWLNVLSVVGDFMRPLKLPVYSGRSSDRRVVYFPGSTIGNLTPEEAHAFLRMSRGQIGRRGVMLVGVDLKKDANVLHAAYNDAKGVTAAFNLNVLARINRELEGDFDLRRFKHYAFYNVALGRIEMHLVSLARQTVNVGSHRFRFCFGESMPTENSCKYSIEDFTALALAAGFR